MHLSKINVKARAVEMDKKNTANITMAAVIVKEIPKTLLVEFVKDLFAQTVAVSVWVAT